MDEGEVRLPWRDGTIVVRKRGSGPPLVLLHGFVGDSRLWEPQLSGLSDEFCVIAWDAPGAGRSTASPPGAEIADWVAALVGLLDGIGLERAHMIGLSWGGFLAQEAVRRHPRRVRSLVLADTYAGWRGSLGADAAQARLAQVRLDANLPSTQFASRYLPQLLAPSASVRARRMLDSLLAEGQAAAFVPMAEAIADADTTSLLAALDVPVLLAWGDADVRSPVSVGRAMAATIPGARLEIIQNAGHIVNLDAPNEFNRLVRAFIRSALAVGGDQS